MQVHLLDATYELFRAHFGAPPRSTPDGREVGAVAGLVASTLTLLTEREVTHMGAATDHVIESFRNERFPGYKTSAGVPEELLAQFPLAERALKALGVVVWPMVEFEADDALATAARLFSKRADRVVLLSPDKDLAQCVVGDRIVTFDRRQGILRGEAGVVEKFGVLPESIPDYLGLVGDSADGLPGVPGWGAKSTAKLLSKYVHIESIPADPAAWTVGVRGSARLAGSLAEHREAAYLYRDLATLRTDVPITEGLTDLRWQGARSDQYRALCDELGLAGLRERPHRWQ